jgi:hypothetical protein
LSQEGRLFSFFGNILATFFCFKKINRLARRKNKILGSWLPAAFIAKIHISKYWPDAGRRRITIIQGVTKKTEPA